MVRVKSSILSAMDDIKASSGLHHQDFVVSKQFAKFFSSYTQSINKAYGRTGSLFNSSFRRKEISNEIYFTRLIWYIHFNPQKHGFTDDFSKYQYSSYQSHLSELDTKLKRNEVVSWFGDKTGYEEFHQGNYLDKIASDLLIDD